MHALQQLPNKVPAHKKAAGKEVHSLSAAFYVYLLCKLFLEFQDEEIFESLV